MKAPVWYGVMDMEGEVHLDASRGFRAYKQTLRGKRIEVVLKQWRKKASRKQHGFWRGCYIPMIAEALGYLPYEYDAVHDAIMRKFVGMKEDSDPKLQIRKSSADLNTVEFNEGMIEQLQVWAATELGIVLPDPDPNFKAKREKRRRAA